MQFRTPLASPTLYRLPPRNLLRDYIPIRLCGGCSPLVVPTIPAENHESPNTRPPCPTQHVTAYSPRLVDILSSSPANCIGWNALDIELRAIPSPLPASHPKSLAPNCIATSSWRRLRPQNRPQYRCRRSRSRCGPRPCRSPARIALSCK